MKVSIISWLLGLLHRDAFFPFGDPMSAQKWLVHYDHQQFLSLLESFWSWGGYFPFQLTWFHKIHRITAFLGKQLL